MGALGLRLFVADAHGAARFASAIVHRDHVERIAVTFQVGQKGEIDRDVMCMFYMVIINSEAHLK